MNKVWTTVIIIVLILLIIKYEQLCKNESDKQIEYFLNK